MPDTTDPGPPLPHQLEQFNLLDAQVAVLDEEELAPGQPQQVILIFQGVPAWTTGPKHYMTAMSLDTALAFGQHVAEEARACGAEQVRPSGLMTATSMAQARQVADGLDRLKQG